MTRENRRVLEIEHLRRKREAELRKTIDAAEWFLLGMLVGMMLITHLA